MYHDRYSDTLRNRRSLTSSGVVRPVVRSNTTMVLSRSSSDKAVPHPHSIIKESVLGSTTRGSRLVREEPRRVRFALPEERRSSVTSGVVIPSHGTRYLRGTLAGPVPATSHHPPLLSQARDSDEDGLRDTLRRASASPLPEPTINYADSSGRFQRRLTEKVSMTALSYLASNGPVSLLESLLAMEGVDVNKPDNEGNTPLHFAAQAGQVECVNYLLSRCPIIEVDARNNLGFTPLMKAAIQGRTKCAKLLLFAGASPTMRDTGRGLRAEQWARFCGRYVTADVIEKLSRHRLLERTTAYGRWGSEPELGPHMVHGRLQPPAITALAQTHQGSIKSRLKKAFRTSSSPSNSFSLVTQLTTAALCASTPVLPDPNRVPPVVKSLIRPLAVPKVQVIPDDSPITSKPL
ncbi:photoreceptor ankyrin repeat protein-like [Macrosteles quadrilineatus]|uniref:photoreceptor ankyrin repeat protein-like n=1 Tax=Macrosteles quadrilineatus TaxID=74068 RepID=UPI0023E13011|nr:photoreceptor ankyrin repeat protein-like [Macrosteles quadrilineatus]